MFVPCNEKHSIREAVLAVVLEGLIDEPVSIGAKLLEASLGFVRNVALHKLEVKVNPQGPNIKVEDPKSSLAFGFHAATDDMSPPKRSIIGAMLHNQGWCKMASSCLIILPSMKIGVNFFKST